MKDALLDEEGRRAVLASTIVSGLPIAQQTAGRATRDALFLPTFPVAFLPPVMMPGFGASLGGVLGGALAWGASRLVPVPTMLVVMALLNLAAMVGMLRLGRGHASAPAAMRAPTAAPSALAALRRVPYLRDLALVVA